MATIDFRTRSAADVDIRQVDLVSFWQQTLPAAIAEHGNLAAEACASYGLVPLGLVVGDDAFTLVPAAGSITVQAGLAEAVVVADIAAEGFSDLVQDMRSMLSFMTKGDIEIRAGRLSQFIAWEPALRALLDGRAAHRPGTATFSDRSGEPLDLDRSFRLTDDRADLAHFLAEAGFALLRGWLDPEDMARIDDDITRALPSYRPGDGNSWWATLADGSQRCVRLQRFEDHSPTSHRMLKSPEWRSIASIFADGHLAPTGIEALVKPIGVVEGISDVPWHRDCDLGGHSYDCAAMTCGISVTPSDEESGALLVVAGSHRAPSPPFVIEPLGLPVVTLRTQPGDITVHLSCTLHMATPPRRGERRVMYTDFALPSRAENPGRAAKISDIRESAPVTVSQPPGYLGG